MREWHGLVPLRVLCQFVHYLTHSSSNDGRISSGRFVGGASWLSRHNRLFFLNEHPVDTFAVSVSRWRHRWNVDSLISIE